MQLSPRSAAPARFRFASPGYRFRFPRDFFNHPEYQTEWWYYSGNLAARNGHEFGFELAFFRFGVARHEIPNASSAGALNSDSGKLNTASGIQPSVRSQAPQHRIRTPPPGIWQVNDIYMAHLALSDLTSRKFRYHERVNRAGPGLAGVNERKERIWNGNWSVQFHGSTRQLQAVAPDFSLRLFLNPEKPLVLNGYHGFSQKAPGAGNASEYFSLTRLRANGTVGLGSRSYPVTGTSWMDHEFSTSPPDSQLLGWDWLAIQLNNNTEIMLYRVRLKGGAISPDSSGTYIDANGTGHHLGIRDFALKPVQTWTSSHSHARYPIEWRLAVPALRLQLRATTPLKDQELVSDTPFSPTYWEGAIRLRGVEARRPVAGVGYLEMTGYAMPG